MNQKKLIIDEINDNDLLSINKLIGSNTKINDLIVNEKIIVDLDNNTCFSAANILIIIQRVFIGQQFFLHSVFLTCFFPFQTRITKTAACGWVTCGGKM